MAFSRYVRTVIKFSGYTVLIGNFYFLGQIFTSWHNLACRTSQEEQDVTDDITDFKICIYLSHIQFHIQWSFQFNTYFVLSYLQKQVDIFPI